MRYRLGYKCRGQWRYFDIVGELTDAMKQVENMFKLGFTQVTIKIIKKSEV